MDNVELASERLVLRPAAEHDLDFNFELRNRPEILALPGCQPRPRSEVANQLRGWLERWDEIGFGTWTIFERKTDERLGRVQLDPIGPGWAGLSPEAIEVGFVVHPAHWSRGIATEATLLAIADCFDRVGWTGWSQLRRSTTSRRCAHWRRSACSAAAWLSTRMSTRPTSYSSSRLLRNKARPRRVTFPHDGPRERTAREPPPVRRCSSVALLLVGGDA